MNSSAASLSVVRPVGKASSYELIQSFIRTASVAQLSHYTERKFVTQDVATEEDGFERRDQMSIILLWGATGTFTLKTHFDLSFARSLLASHTSLSKSEMTDARARDFFKEFSNLQGGFVRRVLGANGVRLGMSLPFLVQGADEADFRKVREPRAVTASWKCRTDEAHELDFTLEVILCDAKIIEEIRSPLEGEIENQIKSIANEAANEVEFMF